MARQNINAYTDVDYHFNPAENAVYDEDKAYQDASVIATGFDNAKKALSDFLDYSKNITAELEKIGTTGIQSSNLDATFETMRGRLHDAEFTLEMSNKEFIKQTQAELDEIEVAKKAAQAQLESSAGKYGEITGNIKTAADSSAKAGRYATQILGDVGAAMFVPGAQVPGMINAGQDIKGYVTEQAKAGQAAGKAVMGVNEKVGDYVYEHVTEPVANGVKTAYGNVKAGVETAQDYVYNNVTEPALDNVRQKVAEVKGGVQAGVQSVKDFAQGLRSDMKQGAADEASKIHYAGR